MKRHHYPGLCLLIPLICLLFICSCSGKRSRLAEVPTVTLNHPYQQVWDALEELVVDDLYCVPKRVNENRGIIETEWVYRFDTEGSLRWMLIGRVEEKGDRTVVRIDKVQERPDSDRERVRRYDRRESSTDDFAQRTGWRKQDIPMDEIRQLYNRLDRKLSTKIKTD